MDDDWRPEWDDDDQRCYDATRRPGRPVVYAAYHFGDWGGPSASAHATFDEAVAAMRADIARNGNLAVPQWIADGSARWFADDDGTLIPFATSSAA